MTAARRFLPTDPRDFLRSIVPLTLLGAAAVFHDARVMVLALLILGTVIAARRNAPVRWAWAAAVPAGASILLGGPSLLGWPTSACTDPGRGLVDAELFRAAVVVGVVLALALGLKANRASLWLRWPPKTFIAWIPLGFVAAAAVVAVFLWVDGSRSVTLEPVGLVLALVYGAASAIADELAWRGALLGWSARVIGVGAAVVGQAVVFGIGPLIAGGDASGLQLILVAGLLGVIVVRTKSLAIALAIHAGASAASYLLIACAR